VAYKDPERQRAYAREWLKRNPQKARDAVRRWRARNPELNRDRRRKYRRAAYVRNAAKINAEKAAYLVSHPEVKREGPGVPSAADRRSGVFYWR